MFRGRLAMTKKEIRLSLTEKKKFAHYKEKEVLARTK